jgi:hypothetical protein
MLDVVSPNIQVPRFPMELMRLVGVSSTGATVAASLRHSIDSQRDIAESDVLSYLIGNVDHVDEVGVSTDVADSNYQLPSQALAARGVNSTY